MSPGGKKILILGADGFIGRHLAFACRAADHQVLASARRVGRLQAMGFDTLTADLADPKTHKAGFWRSQLEGIDYIINAAGLLTGSNALFAAVHVKAPQAVYAAAPKTTRAVLISAVGIDADTPFASYRRQAESVAQAAPIPVTILRPGLVLADTSYGGSSLLRALAALPLATPVVGTGAQPFNPVHAQDLAAVVLDLLARPGERTATGPFELGGPETVSQSGLVSAYRRWLGLQPARLLRLPVPMALLLGRLGDVLRLGPISATSVAQLKVGVSADMAGMAPPVGTQVRGFTTFLNARPAATQDLWQARLYLMRPVLRLSLALIWLLSGLLGLLLPSAHWLGLFGDSLPAPILGLMAKLAGLCDLAIALALLRGWRLRAIGYVQIAVVLAYTLGLSLIAPLLWLDPIGGVLKNIAVLPLIIIWMVLEDER